MKSDIGCSQRPRTLYNRLCSHMQYYQQKLIFFLNFDRTRHIVYCPHSRRLAARVNLMTSYASWLDRSSAAWLDSFTRFTQPVVQPVLKCKHRVIIAIMSGIIVSSSSSNFKAFTRRCCILILVHCSVLFFSRPRSEGWPHHGRTFSICPLSF